MFSQFSCSFMCRLRFEPLRNFLPQVLQVCLLSPVWSPLWSCNFAASSNFPPQVSHRKCRSPASLFWWRRRSLSKKCLLALVAFEWFVRIYCVFSHVPCVIPCAKKHKITFFTWIFFFELVPPKMSQWWVTC